MKRGHPGMGLRMYEERKFWHSHGGKTHCSNSDLRG